MSKRLVVCCDGTWNRPDQKSPTNVAKLALAVAPRDEQGTRQLVYYGRGVGTERFERLPGGGLGIGLSRNVREAYRFLVEHYEPGDELYFLGFSRGAFTARSTVGLVRNAGILRRDHKERITAAYRLYRSKDDKRKPSGIESQLFRRTYSDGEPDIHFVGVWDTVGSLGIPGLTGTLAQRWWGFHDTTLSSKVQRAYHALAIDERRGPFEPTLWERKEDAPATQILEQVWFSGVHSDVGGGYDEPELAEVALLWMVEKARQAGLRLAPDHLQRVTGRPDEQERRLGRQVAPDPLGELHVSRKGLYRLLPPRPRKISEEDGGWVASTAVARRQNPSAAYAPACLLDYLASGGRVTDVDT